VANPGLDTETPPRKARSGSHTAFLIGALIFVVIASVAGAGAWYLRGQSSGDGAVGKCFPAAADSPLDSTHGTVSCSQPEAVWKIMKVIDGPNTGDLMGTCGPDGDALIFVDQENKSYCLDYIN
jgi:hypothetical protein